MCASKSEGNGSFLRLQLNEIMSFNMGVKFAALFYTGIDFLDVWHVCICKSTGSDLQTMFR